MTARMNSWFTPLVNQAIARHDKYCAGGGKTCRTRPLCIDSSYLPQELIAHVNRQNLQLKAALALIDEFEEEDIMPVGQVTLLRQALDGPPFLEN